MGMSVSNVSLLNLLAVFGSASLLQHSAEMLFLCSITRELPSAGHSEVSYCGLLLRTCSAQ